MSWQWAIGFGVLVAVLALIVPRYVRTFFREHWLDLLQLIASLALLGTAIHYARHADATWLRVVGIVGAVGLELTLVLVHPLFRSWVKYLTIDQWRAIDAETDRPAGAAGTFDWRVLVVLVVVAVSLTLQEYIGDRGWFERVFPPHGRDNYFELKGFAWWSGWRVLGYVVMPVIAILAMPREKLLDYHLSLEGFFKHLWIYLLLFTLILPAVAIASTTDAFRHTYPFYRAANRSHFDLWSWEALYAVQFLALEVFFRGFILQGLRRALGSNAIFVMIVPYCMIHYGKPLPETLGAIGAGVILGTLAMRTKSIWGGVLIHVGVAVTMDVLALRGCPPLGSNRGC
jgi:membrane protease YdiL (CAAX protease family)